MQAGYKPQISPLNVPAACVLTTNQIVDTFCSCKVTADA